jgi:hypothetical protein
MHATVTSHSDSEAASEQSSKNSATPHSHTHTLTHSLTHQREGDLVEQLGAGGLPLLLLQQVADALLLVASHGLSQLAGQHAALRLEQVVRVAEQVLRLGLHGADLVHHEVLDAVHGERLMMKMGSKWASDGVSE